MLAKVAVDHFYALLCLHLALSPPTSTSVTRERRFVGSDGRYCLFHHHHHHHHFICSNNVITNTPETVQW